MHVEVITQVFITLPTGEGQERELPCQGSNRFGRVHGGQG